MSSQPCPDVPLGNVLRRTSDHLDALAAEVHLIEHAIGEEFATGTQQSPSTITRLQRLDFLRQSLEDLAMLTLHLSRTEDAETSQDIAAKLRLAHSRLLLIPDASVLPEPEDSSAPAGEVDLF